RDECVNTWASSPLMRARFEIDVESCAPGFFAGLLESENLGVFRGFIFVDASADNLSLAIDNNGAHTRVGRSQTNTFTCQFKRTAYEGFIGDVCVSHEAAKSGQANNESTKSLG